MTTEKEKIDNKVSRMMDIYEIYTLEPEEKWMKCFENDCKDLYEAGKAEAIKQVLEIIDNWENKYADEMFEEVGELKIEVQKLGELAK